jgi:hypothetical protein
MEQSIWQAEVTRQTVRQGLRESAATAEPQMSSTTIKDVAREAGPNF